MKKILLLLMLFVPALTFAGCSTGGDEPQIENPGGDDNDDETGMGTLTMRIIPIGKITSALNIFDEMQSRLEFTFDNTQQ